MTWVSFLSPSPRKVYIEKVFEYTLLMCWNRFAVAWRNTQP